VIGRAVTTADDSEAAAEALVNTVRDALAMRPASS